MKKIVAFNGSQRKAGNTSILLKYFVEGARHKNGTIQSYYAHELDIDYCKGCLRCNLIGECSVRNDDWEKLSVEILASDVLVFATPIYFHHVTAPLKAVVDRFRSFVEVKLSETGLIHTPRLRWKKDFVLLLTMGSSDSKEARPVIELFDYMTDMLGPENKLHIITATRMVAVKQLEKTKDELAELYPKIGLSDKLAEEDYARNKELLESTYQLGMKLA